MPINSGGMQISDENIKMILGERDLTITILNQMLQNLQSQLQVGYDMKLTMNPDGTYKLEPEGKEFEILLWVEQTLGSTALKNKIQEFIDQRSAQKDWDELHQLEKDFKDLDEEERNKLKNTIREKANSARSKKV